MKLLHWIKRLFEDINGLPSSRLCISWVLTCAVVYYLDTLDATKLGLCLTAITTMTSMSVVEKVKEPLKELIKQDKE